LKSKRGRRKEVERATRDGKRERWWGKGTLGKDKREMHIIYSIIYN